MAKLYEITADYERLAEMDMETDGDVEAFVSLMHEVEGTFDQKAENYCKLIRNLESEAEAYKVEKERYAKKQKKLENRIEEIKKYLKYEASKIIDSGASRKVGLFTIAIRNNPESLQVHDDSEIPEEYFIVERHIDAAKLKKAMQDGAIIPGAFLYKGTSLRIS